MQQLTPRGADAPALFTPFTLRSVTFPNRIVVSPMCQYSAEDGVVNGWHLAHHGRFALSGVGGALVEATAVVPEGRITPGDLGLWQDGQIAGLRQVVELYHAQGIPVGIQLAHAGRKASAAKPWDGAGPLAASDPAQAWEAVGPSPIPMTEIWPVPRALSGREIEAVVEAFAAAAGRAVSAGFDFIEIHGAHGYLIHSFLSPLANRRDDSWGGSLDGRMRLALHIAEALRAAMPAEMPLFYRTSSVDGFDGGLTIEDTVVLARELKSRGVDMLDCSSGGIVGPSGRAADPPSPGYLVPYAAAVRGGAGIATMAVGLIMEPEQAEAVVAEGSADLVAMGRQLLAEPSFPYRAAMALGAPQGHDVLPLQYAHYLKRRVFS